MSWRGTVASVRRPKVGTDTVSTGLDREELTALVKAAQADSPRSHAVVLLLGLNGLRISETLVANVDDLETERGHGVLGVTRKSGTQATIPLAPKTAEAVDAYVGDRNHRAPLRHGHREALAAVGSVADAPTVGA